MFEPYTTENETPNCFWPVSKDNIEEEEKKLGFSFPSELKAFWLEIGYGFFKQGIEDTGLTHVNRVLSAKSVRRMLLDPSDLARPREGFPEGVMPFFDLGESTYLVLRPTSTHPHRVYWPGGKEVITETVVEFFTKLYRNASFYRDKSASSGASVL
jgi:hypothetical protein